MIDLFFKYINEISVSFLLVITAIHDVALAIHMADTAFVLRHGELVLAGNSSAVLSPGSLGEVFGVDLAWATDDAGKRHLICP